MKLFRVWSFKMDLFRVCVLIVFGVGRTQAIKTIEYFSDLINYRELSYWCDVEGGTPLMNHEVGFNQFVADQSIPYGQEFWVADYLYSHWVVPIDCVRRSSMNSPDLNIKVTSNLGECNSHCQNYQYLAIKTDYCVCLSSYPSSTTAMDECSVECSDVGMCGGQDSSGRNYLNVYTVEPAVVSPEIDIKTSTATMGTNYIECLTSRCYYNDYRGVHCTASQNYAGLCGDDTLTSSATSYTKAMAKCWSNSGIYFKDSCANVTNSVLWIGPLRFLTQSENGAEPGFKVAKGAKCTKSSTGTVNCISTNEQTDLPFVCLKRNGTGQTNTGSTAPNQPDTNKESDGTTGIIIGVVIGVIAVPIAVVAIVAVIFFCRKQNNKFKTEAPRLPQSQMSTQAKTVYETPKPREQHYDHEYADTKNVYHQYIEIKDTGSTPYSQHSDAQSTGYNNDSYLKVPSSTTPVNAKDANISWLGVDDQGYLNPQKSPNFGRKLPDIPNVRL